MAFSQLPSPTDTINIADSAKVHLANVSQALLNDPNGFIENLLQNAINFGLKVLAALVIYAIGAWVIKWVKSLLKRFFVRRNTDRALASFVSSLTSITLTIILVVITIGALGINTTSIAALLAAGGMAVGMALSGTVQNFAGGIMILAFKPFKAGDYIEALGYSGVVTELNIVYTKLTTLDNRSIVLPNGSLSNGNINNFSQHDHRRVDWKVNVSYGSDIEKVKKACLEILSSDKRVLTADADPTVSNPFIALSEMKDSSIELVVRAWVISSDYWDVYFDFNEKVYSELPKKGISFPFPQIDVHLTKQN